MKLELKMPRLGVNDNYVTLGDWFVEEGDFVSIGQKVALLETSKQVLEIESEMDGYFYPLYEIAEEIAVGTVYAIISDEKIEEKHLGSTANENKDKNKAMERKLTKKAQELVREHHVDINSLPVDKIIREKDILKLLHIHDENPFINMINKNDLLIAYGGGLAKMCIDILKVNKDYNIKGILDDTKSIDETLINIPILGKIENAAKFYSLGYNAIINAFGGIYNDINVPLFHLRKEAFIRFKKIGFFLPNVIHPTACIEPSSFLGEGNIILAGAIIGSEAVIENNCYINTAAVISHDCIIHDHVKVAPGAIIAGRVEIGENSLIGMGTTIYMNVKIGKNVIIGNGKNIFENIPDNTVLI